MADSSFFIEQLWKVRATSAEFNKKTKNSGKYKCSLNFPEFGN